MSRLKVTWLLVSYRQEAFIEEALSSALAQSRPMEILVSDDCSPDATFERARTLAEAYRGPHTVQCFQTPRNVRLAGNLNEGMSRATGEVIIVAAGDDVSEPDRAERIATLFEAKPALQLVHSDVRIISASGAQQTSAPRVSSKPESTERTGRLLDMVRHSGSGVLGATAAWRRGVFDVFGPLAPDVVFEDMVIPFRAALLGELSFIPEALVRYRRHGGNVHFKRPDEVLAVAELLTDLARDARARSASQRSRGEDLARWLSLHPEDVSALGPVGQALHQATAEAAAELSLFETPKARARILARALLQGTPPRRWVRWFLTCYFPGLLWRYRQWQQPATDV
jgi:glycosyltransferase involved in cell wall biosynthesis